MLYYLLNHVMQRYFSPLNVFRYITVRTVYASLTAMFLALVFGPWLIRRLREMQIGQFIREEGPQGHQKKAGTPTMGGVLIVLSTAVPTLLWADLTNPFILLALFALIGFAAIGFIDDYAKVAKKQNLGLTARYKLLLQVVVSLVVGVVLLVLATRSAHSTQLVFPFFKKFQPDLVVHSFLDPANFGGHLWPLAFVPFLVFHRAGDCGVLERSESHRRAGWLGDWLHGHRCGRAYGADVRQQQLSLGAIFGHSIYSASRRVDGVLRRAGRCFARISLVQRASGRDIYGRCGFAVAGRNAGRDRGGHQTGDFVVLCRWNLCD